jgi:hypothetical protein
MACMMCRQGREGGATLWRSATRYIGISGIGENATARAAVERVAPQRLYGECAGREVDVGRGALTGRDPGTLIRILGAA